MNLDNTRHEGMATYTVGYWMNEKKSKKFIQPEFIELCRTAGLELVQMDLQRPLEEQGPFSVILHKLTDYIIKADQGDKEAGKIVEAFENYLAKHPKVLVIDPLDNVRKLLDRTRTYSLIQHSQLDGVFIPSFVELSTSNHEENMEALRKAGIKFPFVCKPTVAHGCKLAHQMALIFNEEGVKDVSPPCVAMNFVNHNALMFKIFVVADNWNVVERPSLKNFYPSDQKTIFFDSHDISKANSDSFLTQLDKTDQVLPLAKSSVDVLEKITSTVRRELGMALFGVDVVIENGTGRYAIVDINAFPGYDGVPRFYEMLRDCIVREIEAANPPAHHSCSSCSSPENEVIRWTAEKDQSKTRTNIEEDSGIETADSSDEKKHKKQAVKASRRIQATRVASNGEPCPECAHSHQKITTENV